MRQSSTRSSRVRPAASSPLISMRQLNQTGTPTSPSSSPRSSSNIRIPHDAPTSTSSRAGTHYDPPLTFTNESLSHSLPESSAHHRQNTEESVTQSLDQRVFLPPPSRSVQNYLRIARRATAWFTQNWVPHVLTEEEYQGFHLDTQKRIQRIRMLEAVACTSLQYEEHIEVQHRLFFERLEYRIIFPRIFPMNRLPTEILSNIFRYVAWGAEDPSHGINWRLWLTWTCRRWRYIMLNDSTVWNAIWFKDHPLQFERSLEWLKRAGRAPLDIRINDSVDKPFTAEAMNALLDRLFEKVSNIRMLVVVAEHWGPVLAVLDRLRIVAEAKSPIAIERFELHRSGSPYVQPAQGYTQGNYLEPIPLFGGANALSLNYFSINGVYLDWKQSSLTNLTTIDIRRLPFERSPSLLHFRAMLRNSPYLQKLVLDGAGPDDRVEEDNIKAQEEGPIFLGYLTDLVLANFSPSYGVFVATQFAAPHVRTLTLMNFMGQDYTPFYRVLTCSFPEVVILTLWNIDIPEMEFAIHTTWALIELFDSMPRVKYLRIAGINPPVLDVFTFDALSLPEAKQCGRTEKRIICPNLCIVDVQSADPDVVATWGEERKDAGAALKKIYISRRMAETMSVRQFTALSAICTLFIVESGSRTPEEDDFRC